MKKCEDCIHSKLCFELKQQLTYKDIESGVICEHYDDRRGWIVLPNISGDIVHSGDSIYKIEYDTSSCNTCKSLSYGTDGVFCTETYSLYPEVGDEKVCPKHSLKVYPRVFKIFFTHKESDFGKTIFKDKNAAEDELGRLMKEGR